MTAADVVAAAKSAVAVKRKRKRSVNVSANVNVSASAKRRRKRRNAVTVVARSVVVAVADAVVVVVAVEAKSTLNCSNKEGRRGIKKLYQKTNTFIVVYYFLLATHSLKQTKIVASRFITLSL